MQRVCSLSTWTHDSYGTHDGRTLFVDDQDRWFKQDDDGAVEAVSFQEVKSLVAAAPPETQQQFAAFLQKGETP